MSNCGAYPVCVIGAGPAGLTAAYELARRGHAVNVMECGDQFGGISRTETRDGYRFDIGGHRFYTKVPQIDRLWRQMLGDDFIKVNRLSRIYYGGQFYDYPLSAFGTLRKIGLRESALILLSYFGAKLKPLPQEDTFEQWVVNRFGRRLFDTFFKTYTEKVWGIPCDRINSEWAAQRIQGLSLTSAVRNAILGDSAGPTTLIQQFDYPRLGPGQMWERFAGMVRSMGGAVHTGVEVLSLHHDSNGSITELTIHQQGGPRQQVPVSHVISSIPLTTLLHRLDPPPPSGVLAAAGELKYRDFILVGLIVNRRDLFPDQWIYIHSPDVRVGRIQNFGNWSAAMVPDPAKSSLGMEYFCTRGDDLWAMSDEELTMLARRELSALGLADSAEIQPAVVIRQPRAYPVYDGAYRGHLDVIRGYLDRFANLQTVGRNGMHRYNNQDHSMLTGLLAARNILGERHDLWAVNTERSYHEAADSNGITAAAESAERSPDMRALVATVRTEPDYV